MWRMVLLAATLSLLVFDTANGAIEGARLEMPPILEGYNGTPPYKSKYGGLVGPTLLRYIRGKPTVNSRGTWYDIVTWAARTHNCDLFPESVSCMACAMEMPPFTGPAGVVPIAVGGEFFGTPEKGATCGMCVRVFMPQSYKRCADHETNPFCAGDGMRPYIRYMSASWAWGAKIRWSRAEKMYYYDAIIIEWFDRAAKIPYQITMPTQGKGPTAKFGDWPVRYRAIPCPVGKHTMRFQFLDFSKPVPITRGICNNQLSEPCGGEAIQFGGKPLGYLKFMITQQRIPISAVSLRIEGKWNPLKRSGDNFWQPASTYKKQNATTAMDVKISCADGSAPLYQYGIIPSNMLCGYQTPGCIGWSSSLQCS